MKKTPGDIITLLKCTINDNHDVWFLRYEVWQNFLTFWAIFCPFTPIWTWKIKILKKWKKHLKISSFYMCTKNHDHTKNHYAIQSVPEIWQVRNAIFILCSYTYQLKKIKLKNAWRYHFTHIYQKLLSHDAW